MTTESRPRRVVVAGAGMAAHRFAMRLSARAPGQFHITIVGEEASRPYNRVGLSSLLAGAASQDDLSLEAIPGVEWILGVQAREIDRAGHRLSCSDGRWIGWDRLVLACGSVPIIPPIPGSDAAGVHVFRTVEDVTHLLAAAGPGIPAVVIGGGLLGLEAAHGLRLKGADVEVVHLAPHLMERQLDPRGGRLLADQLARRGIRSLVGAQAKALTSEPDGHVSGVMMSDGQRIPARLVVFAVGVRPRIELARVAGLECGRGIRVDDALRTSDPDIHAIGECIEHRDRCYGLVAPVREQADACAAAIAGEAVAYAGSSESTHLKVSGIPVFSAGRVEAIAGDDEIVLEDVLGERYRRLLVHDDRLVGAILYGDADDGPWYADLVRSRATLGCLRERLAFGPALAGEPEPQPTRVSPVPVSRLDRQVAIHG